MKTILLILSMAMGLSGCSMLEYKRPQAKPFSYYNALYREGVSEAQEAEYKKYNWDNYDYQRIHVDQ